MNLSISFVMNNNELYLAYVDPTLNSLKEIESSSMYLNMKPFEKVIRRFYICSPDLQFKKLTVVADIDGPQKYAYSVKVRIGFDYSDLESFNHASGIACAVVSSSQNYYDNAIPVDILIESYNKTETCNILDISLNASEDMPR